MSTAWYRTGTIALAQNSATVTGTGTQWSNSLYGVAPGQMLLIPGAGTVVMYEIQRVVTDTQITLTTPYTGAAATGQQYAIVTALVGSVADFSRQLSVLVSQWQGQLDGWQKILTGTGDVTLTAPDGTSVTLKSQAAISTAVNNMLDKTKNLSDVVNPAASRTSLGALGAGDYGVGGTLRTPADFLAVPSSTQPPGFWRYNASVLNSPGGVNGGAYGAGLYLQYGSPMSGLFLVVDLNGNIFASNSVTSSSTAINWRMHWNTSTFPPGIPLHWPLTAPAGWLKCNGAAFNTTTYPLLAAAYPSGTLPNITPPEAGFIYIVRAA